MMDGFEFKFIKTVGNKISQDRLKFKFYKAF